MWIAMVVMISGVHLAQAGSATWNVNPGTGDWNTASNWTPATVPNGSLDVATFDLSSNVVLSLSANVEVSGVVFATTAVAYTMTAGPSATLLVSGTGITNNSAQTQNFIADAVGLTSPLSIITFGNSASAGTGTTYTIRGASSKFRPGAEISFQDTSNAGGAVFNLQTGAIPGAAGGMVVFQDASDASNGVFVANFNPTTSGGPGIDFMDNAGAGDATFTLGGSQRGLGRQSFVEFFNSSTADHSVITANGGSGGAGIGAKIIFHDTTTADGATLIANAGTNGGAGGTISFQGDSSGGTSQVQLSGNGVLDCSTHNVPGVTVGSIEGDGSVLIGANNLTIGTNNLNKIFAGVISGSGSLTMSGATRVTLRAANTYLGGTTIEIGAIIASNPSGSATGPGPVQVNRDTLAGDGIIAGPVTIGNGRKPNAYLEPSLASNRSTLTIQSLLTFKSDGAYVYKINTNSATADQVIANGVRLENGASFRLNTVQNRKLTVGTVFIVLSNTSASATNGTFVGLPDGSTIEAGSNTFQANYEGGDGNDLTLTVVP